MRRMLVPIVAVSSCLLLAAGLAVADDDRSHRRICKDLPSHAELTAVLKSVAVLDNAGIGNEMWAAVVNQDGFVCAVTFSGEDRNAQWTIGRVASAAKAHTSNMLSLPAGRGGLFAGIATSTANAWNVVQPGRFGYGLTLSNPVDTDVAYRGNPARYGTRNDPMVGRRIGGVIAVAGGLALYNSDGDRIGALGLSGDTACSDHIQAWKVRDALGLDYVPFGVSPTGDDNIIFDLIDDFGGNPESPSGFGHPYCFNPPAEEAAVSALPVDFPIGPNP